MGNLLITGGAGFIGRKLATRALVDGWNVTILDNLSPQIHGTTADWPEGLDDCRKILGSVTDEVALKAALAGQEVVVHLAAETGTGQSMYQIERYSHVNVCGTSVLLEQVLQGKGHNVKRIVVASSRAIYGEGKYSCPEHGIVYPSVRTASAMERQQYEPQCPVCGSPAISIATDEGTPAQPTSFYGLTKYVQEQEVLMFAHHLGLSACALRYQNVYGPGQSLKNPYTGILAIFTNLARAGSRIRLFEDGMPTRDFVYVDDVAEATWQCAVGDSTRTAVYNVGSGQAVSVREVAEAIVKYFGSSSSIEVTGEYRLGDIRHNRADISAIRQELGWQPAWNFHAGLERFLHWAEQEDVEKVRYEESLDELRSRGLMNRNQ